MTRYAKRKDNTQAEVEAALRDAGWDVYDFSRAGWGVPDLIARKVGYALWVECKSAGEDLTPAEERFRDICPGDHILAHDGAEAVALATLGMARRMKGK